jgi:hypothetical protein
MFNPRRLKIIRRQKIMLKGVNVSLKPHIATAVGTIKPQCL